MRVESRTIDPCELARRFVELGILYQRQDQLEATIAEIVIVVACGVGGDQLAQVRRRIGQCRVVLAPQHGDPGHCRSDVERQGGVLQLRGSCLDLTGERVGLGEATEPGERDRLHHQRGRMLIIVV
ncbi:MAG TPA: hypothetical protein VK034_21480, partial [Enhygromyxa sp.]|nr:hypothetical protein [Enhygromyxa sp.]